MAGKKKLSVIKNIRKITEEQSVEARAVLSRGRSLNGSWGTSGAGRKQVDLGPKGYVVWNKIESNGTLYIWANNRKKGLITIQRFGDMFCHTSQELLEQSPNEQSIKQLI